MSGYHQSKATARTRELRQTLVAGGFGEVVLKISTSTEDEGYTTRHRQRSVVWLDGEDHIPPVRDYLADHAPDIDGIFPALRDDQVASYTVLIIEWEWY